MNAFTFDANVVSLLLEMPPVGGGVEGLHGVGDVHGPLPSEAEAVQTDPSGVVHGEPDDGPL